MLLCAKVTVHKHVCWRTVLIASCQGQPLRCAMCGMTEGLRLQCLQLTPESRTHCVVAVGEQRHFHWRNFGFLSIRRAALWAQAVFICLCTVGIYAAAEACTFQTTSGGCINSHPLEKHQSEGENSTRWSGLPAWMKCVFWGLRFKLRHICKHWNQHVFPFTHLKGYHLHLSMIYSFHFSSLFFYYIPLKPHFSDKYLLLQ